MSYARECIGRIAGYVPGEQPQDRKYVKLNTNENPYPPSPAVGAALREFDWTRLRLYPEPSALMVRKAVGDVYGFEPDWVICGNGSDDLLTIAMRTFVDQGAVLAYSEPSYSLYPVLADLQGAGHRAVALDDSFQLPGNAAELAGDAPLFIVANPNAPTGNLLDQATLRKIASEFKGVLWIDEAYVDFADESCLELCKEFKNVVVSRTLSKSFSLAGLRLGYAVASPELIFEMNKVKDSYNIDMLTQVLGTAALRDVAYMGENAKRIRATREATIASLKRLGCEIEPSASNFIFARPPKAAEDLFHRLKARGYLVRYFKLPRVSDYLRITVGTSEDMESFVRVFGELLDE